MNTEITQADKIERYGHDVATGYGFGPRPHGIYVAYSEYAKLLAETETLRRKCGEKNAVFDELWKSFIEESEVGPSPEEEGFARWGWNMASGDYGSGFTDGIEVGYLMCGSCSHVWEGHDGECGVHMPDGSICGCQKVIASQTELASRDSRGI